MPHGYSKASVANDRIAELWRKRHKNGETTEVQIDKVGTPASGGNKLLVTVSDPRGSERVGKFQTLSEARSAAKRWMKQNPKGVSGNMGGGFLPGMNGAQNSNDFFG